ncbi:phosphate propanoyltransferase [Clostridium sp. HBUAS56010]|uniref:phosphate propanoyltransferase n=1 Tax=Clostridium sp. HBUAS56010 TaxID=2571127 RepID=UPI001178B02E|nr:phosphate propanoyltransferase [Clostridium sp. HBUAS56010]
MDKYEAVIKLLMEAVQSDSKKDDSKIPVGVSNRHVHLSQEDLESLFGKGYELTNMKELSQPGQYACKETVTVCGPKGAIEKVRILGPVRKQTQVEILVADGFKLGKKAEPKMSGELAGTPGITLVGPNGSVETKEGLIIAQRHIHMSPSDALRFGVQDGQTVSIKTEGIRGGIFDHVAIRVTDTSSLECHLDTEEANAMGLGGSASVTIVK